jgi:hypothetical protein
VTSLQMTPEVMASLTSAFLGSKQLAATDVSGTAPNSVYYAFDPSTMTYWAMVTFQPSSQASPQVQNRFQDGGSMGLFSMPTGGSWSVRSGSVPTSCAQVAFFPAAVLAAWNMSTTGLPSCQ